MWIGIVYKNKTEHEEKNYYLQVYKSKIIYGDNILSVDFFCGL